MQRFILEGEKLRVGEYEIREERVVRQMRSVLRAKPGERFMLCDGRGREGVFRLEGFGKAFAVGKIERCEHRNIKLSCDVLLACCLLKRENFELVAQKATEIGVTSILPIISQRTIKQSLKVARLRLMMKEASEQCGRTVLPSLLPQLTLCDALEQCKKEKRVCVVCDARGDSFQSRVRTHSSKPLAVFIGPEGGWSDDEMRLFKIYRAQNISLGPLILRAETAAIVASFLTISYL